jgi:hypothetical protein
MVPSGDVGPQPRGQPADRLRWKKELEEEGLIATDTLRQKLPNGEYRAIGTLVGREAEARESPA